MQPALQLSVKFQNINHDFYESVLLLQLQNAKFLHLHEGMQLLSISTKTFEEIRKAVQQQQKISVCLPF